MTTEHWLTSSCNGIAMPVAAAWTLISSSSSEAVDRLKSNLNRGPAGSLLGKPGGVFVLAAATVPDDDRILIEAAARAVLRVDRGSLAEQLRHEPRRPDLTAELPATVPDSSPAAQQRADGPPEDLVFWNGFGGFTPDSREYFIVIDGTDPGGPRLPPAPWINVLANPGVGCLATEAGSGYTWAGNSQMNRLTPWSNDPVSDSPGEVVYLRDEATGEFWSPTPLPCGGGANHHRSPWPRLHSLRSQEPRAGAGTALARPVGRPGQARVRDRSEHKRPPSQADRDLLRRVGFGNDPGQCAVAGRVRA